MGGMSIVGVIGIPTRKEVIEIPLKVIEIP
jgi:hypothetical protein